MSHSPNSVPSTEFDECYKWAMLNVSRGVWDMCVLGLLWCKYFQPSGIIMCFEIYTWRNISGQREGWLKHSEDSLIMISHASDICTTTLPEFTFHTCSTEGVQTMCTEATLMMVGPGGVLKYRIHCHSLSGWLRREIECLSVRNWGSPRSKSWSSHFMYFIIEPRTYTLYTPFGSFEVAQF